ncbi:MAG: tetratricopeptide repeat protein [Verrucomicrobiae bacterium]|nr:tetratricopeptide repeat protein [Verrucomicrobiae bacterium]
MMRQVRKWFWPFIIVLFCAGGVGFFLALGWLKPQYHKVRAAMYNDSARKFLEQGDKESARIQLQNSLRHDPDRADTWSMWAEVLREQGDKQYLFFLAKAYELNSSDEKSAIAALRACVENRRADIANLLLQKILKTFPNNPEVWHLTGVLFLSQQRYPEGYQALNKAKELAPDDQRIQVSIATLELVSSDPAISKRGREKLEQLRDKPEFFAAATQSLAEATSVQDPAAAVKLWEEVIAKSPDNWAARLRRLDLRRKIEPNSSEVEIEILWKIAKTAPQRRDLIVRTGSWLGPEAAVRRLEFLDPAERDQPETRLIELAVFASQNRWEEAAELARSETKKVGTPEQLLNFWLWLCRAQFQVNDSSSARVTVRSAVQLVGNDHQLAFRAGDTLERWNMSEQALEFYAIAETSTTRLKLLALTRSLRIHERQRDTDKMLECYDKMLAVLPGNLVIKNNTAALLLLGNKDLERAMGLAKEVYEQKPDEINVADTYARALALNGRVQEAVAVYAKMPVDAFKQSAIRLHYADALRLAGRVAEAKQQVADLDPQSLLPKEQDVLKRIKIAD